MKALLALAGVAVFGSAVFFIARGKSLPSTAGKQANGNVGRNPSPASIASQFLTSQNVAALGGLVDKLGGGAASPAPKGGDGGSGFVTAY